MQVNCFNEARGQITAARQPGGHTAAQRPLTWRISPATSASRLWLISMMASGLRSADRLTEARASRKSPARMATCGSGQRRSVVRAVCPIFLPTVPPETQQAQQQHDGPPHSTTSISTRSTGSGTAVAAAAIAGRPAHAPCCPTAR